MGWIKGLYKQAPKVKYSQYGEEYYLKTIFDNIGTTNKGLVDIGAWDGTHLSNTKIFREVGWSGLLIDGKSFPGVEQLFVKVDNINELLKKKDTHKEFDLLSIDIDGNDYWILDKVLSEYKPRVIVSEYNSEFDPSESKTIKYNPDFTFKANNYYGYTMAAGQKLAEKYGYTIIFQNSNLNLYYLRNDCVNCEVPPVPNRQFDWWKIHGEGEWVYV